MRSPRRSPSVSLGGRTVLVCGGAGFIGSNFIHHLLASHPRVKVVNFDALTYCGNLRNLVAVAHDRRYRFVRGDIADARAVARAYKRYRPTAVVNFAAETHVDRSIHGQPRDFLHANTDGVFTLLEEARRYGKLVKFVQVSTDEVYGSLPLGAARAFTEASPLNPTSPYAATKACGDLLCLAYAKTFGLPVAVTRCGNNFGPFQYPEKLIPFFVLRALASEPLPMYGDGRNRRDWVHVLDHCRAIEAVVRRGQPGQAYNVGARHERSNREVAAAILAALPASRSQVRYVADRPAHDRRYAIDPTKIERELGWRPRHSFGKAFAATVRWYVEHPAWVAQLQRRGAKFNEHLRRV